LQCASPRCDDRRTARVLIATLAVAVLVGAASGTTAPNAGPVRILRGGCSDSAPCHYAAGSYRLGPDAIIPDLRLTLPSGWFSTENDVGELALIPSRARDDRLFVWRDLSAVKSSGPRAGSALSSVGTTANALIAWLTRNHDFLIVSAPSAGTGVRGVKGKTLTVGVSKSAKFGDPGCPSNPRCAALFTNTDYWGSEFYAIGFPEEARISIGTVHLFGARRTFFVTLDAPNHAALTRLAAMAKPIISSIRLPKS
jgi:hypothetical protein